MSPIKDYKTEISRPAVFIFGAGATRAGLEGELTVPPPLDADFFEIAKKIREGSTKKLSDSVLNHIYSLYGRTYDVGLEEYYRDIEMRETIGVFAKPPHQPPKWAQKRECLEKLIRHVCIHTTCMRSKSGAFEPLRSELHSNMLDLLCPGDTIVTFNYDLVIEESFLSRHNEIWNPVDGYGVHQSNKTCDWCNKWFKRCVVKKSTESKITLLKMHGSLNWELYANRAIRLIHRPYQFKTKGDVDKNMAILPPGIAKKIDTYPYKELWKSASSKLLNCKSVVIIGYSMPTADIAAKALFAEASRSRTAGSQSNYLRGLYLIDRNPEVKEKLKQVFSAALGPTSIVTSYDRPKEFAEDFSNKIGV